MYYNHNRSSIFSQGSISEIFQKIHRDIKTKINALSENYILNVNENEYIEYLVNDKIIDFPVIHFEQVYADSYESNIPAEYFPGYFEAYKGESYKKEVIQYFIPVSGDIDILNYSPANIIFISGGGENIRIEKNELLTEIINFSNNPEDIKFSYERNIERIHNKYDALKRNVDDFNNSLNSFIKSLFNERKQGILNKQNLLASLGVPLKQKQNVPSTFSIPKPLLREKIIVRPIVTEKEFKPEPTLDEKNYNNILKLINDVGKNFERMPSLYKGKGEEDLRDHILMTLDPNFDLGSASGETFNKSGKTDIQLRYDSSVVFIAECKFWAGEKQYHTTIDQLLKYLTWRDNKASLIIFVKQKDFSSILNKIKAETNKHSNYLGYINNSDENWFNFRFHLNGDNNREVKIAVQLYHLPLVSK